MEIKILLLMIFLHIVDDFYLQGVLARMKQKSWWEHTVSDPLYRHDYIVALIEHAFSWTFMVMLPVTFPLDSYRGKAYFICFVANMIIHALVDHLKANAKKISLITDQCLHLCQIMVTWIILIGSVI